MSRGFDDEPHAALKPSDGNGSKTKAFGHASDSLFAGKMKGTADSAKDDISAAKKASQRRMIRNAVSSGFSDKVHQKISEYDDDNVGVEAAEKTSGAAEQAVRIQEELREDRKIHQARQKSREFLEGQKDWTDDDLSLNETDVSVTGSDHDPADTASGDNAGLPSEQIRQDTADKPVGDSPGKVGDTAGNGPKQKRPEVSYGASPAGADDLLDNSVTPGGIHAGGNTFGADSPSGGSSGGRGGFGTQVHESAGTMKFAGMDEDLGTSPFHSNPDSRKFQKKQIKRQYATAIREKNYAQMMEAGGHKAPEGIIARVKNGITGIGEGIVTQLRNNSHLFILCAIAGLVVGIIAAMVSSCTVVFEGTSEAVMSSSFTATEENIKAAENYYRGLEADLRQQLIELEEDNPGYDEYRIERGEIGHNPFELAAFLTVLYEDYSLKKVRNTLDALFAAQYSLSQHASIETVTETRTVRVGESLGTVVTSGYCNCAKCCGKYAGGPTSSGVMPTPNHTIAVDMYDPFLPEGTRVVMNGTEYVVEDTGPLTKYGVIFDVYYDDHDVAEAHGHQNWEAFLADDNGANEITVTQTSTKNILTISVNAHSLREVINNYPLTEVQKARFELLLQTKGNRPDLFADDIYSNFAPGAYTSYDIPPEALSDVRFANMIREGEKYLGYPYVWGGESPETSFDCSGFVSWVINHCGNGWSYGRLTAEELRQVCAIIPPSEAKPGDLIFFQGTYDTDGASHVGIYVGNNTMLHCGHPVQYASLDTDYWRAHFYCFGRIP